MRKPQAPCYGCQDRERVAAEHGGNCHGAWCEGWQKYMAEKHAYNRMLHRPKAANIDAIQYMKSTVARKRREKHDR